MDSPSMGNAPNSLRLRLLVVPTGTTTVLVPLPTAEICVYIGWWRSRRSPNRSAGRSCGRSPGRHRSPRSSPPQHRGPRPLPRAAHRRPPRRNASPSWRTSDLTPHGLELVMRLRVGLARLKREEHVNQRAGQIAEAEARQESRRGCHRRGQELRACRCRCSRRRRRSRRHPAATDHRGIRPKDRAAAAVARPRVRTAVIATPLLADGHELGVDRRSRPGPAAHPRGTPPVGPACAHRGPGRGHRRTATPSSGLGSPRFRASPRYTASAATTASARPPITVLFIDPPSHT